MAIVRKAVSSSPDIPGFFNSVEIVEHYAPGAYVGKKSKRKKPTVLPGPSGNTTRLDFRRNTGRKLHHHSQPTISNDKTQTGSSTKTCLNTPSKKADDNEWYRFLSKKYNGRITAVFDRPKQIQKFSGPDYYAALTSTKNFREVFKELINNYNENKNFNPTEKIELQKLYELGYILPLTNQKAKKINQELSLLSKSLKNNIRFLPVPTKILRLAYHLCGGKEKNPTIDSSVEFLKSFDFHLPASFLINRAKANAPEKTKSEKYHKRINTVNSRPVPEMRKDHQRRAVWLTRRYTEQDDIPENHSIGDPIESRRTQQRPGRREKIFDQQCRRFNRDRLQESSASDEEPITQNTSSETQEASTFNAEDLKTQLKELDLQKAKESPTQAIKTPQLFKIFTQTVKNLSEVDSMTAAKFLALFFSSSNINFETNYAELRGMRKHNINPTPYQENFLQTAYELGYLITPQITPQTKKELKGGIDSSTTNQLLALSSPTNIT